MTEIDSGNSDVKIAAEAVLDLAFRETTSLPSQGRCLLILVMSSCSLDLFRAPFDMLWHSAHFCAMLLVTTVVFRPMVYSIPSRATTRSSE
jgi:hypothetical protein